ncbi:MAG: aspartate--tRNA ligase, partial [Bacteroidaceae bacterium]|nr:aspartate--tRNA ligase [Bacteroidaceae bacterium]
MFRSKNCGELRLANVGESVVLSGWVQSVHNLGALTFVDLRDRYGITQLAFNEDCAEELKNKAGKLGREYVVQAKGTVAERYSKNKNLPTGEIEIMVDELNILNESITPPFTIEEQSEGGDDIR